MKKILSLIIVLSLISCGDSKEVKLPIANGTVVENVIDHSPIYFFFEKKGNDTLVDVNRKNSISSTHWIFNIDKRLPLRLVVPELITMQAKKESSVHKSNASQNYFSYMDDTKKTLAFLPFTKVKYHLEKPKNGIIVYFSKGKIWVDNQPTSKEKLELTLINKLKNENTVIRFGFDKKTLFGDYVQNKIFVFGLQLPSLSLNSFQEDYIY